ncbi:MAG: hypothetical protein ACR2LH_06565 [Thermoleophilaceae bacterium]
MTGIEFNRRLAAIPAYPVAETYALQGDPPGATLRGDELVKLASNESPFGPAAAVIGAIQGRLETLNR